VINFKSFLTETIPGPNKIKTGDEVINDNPECRHYKSKGKVTKVKTLKGKGGVVGKKIEYKVKNKGKAYKPGDTVEKTEIQLDKE